MSLGASIRTAGERLRSHPELFGVGLALSAVQTAVALLATVAVSLLPAGGRLLESAAASVALLLVLPLSVGVYELTLTPEPNDSSRESMIRGILVARSRYVRVLRTDAMVVLGSGIVGALTAVGTYVVATGIRFVRYVIADPPPPQPLETVFVLGGAVLVGGVVANVCFRFADALTAFRDLNSIPAVVVSAASAWRHRRAFAGFALVIAGVRAVSFALLELRPRFGDAESFVVAPGTPSNPSVGVQALAGLPTSPGVELLAVLAAVVVVNGITVTVTATLHATFYEAHVVSVLESDLPGVDSDSGVSSDSGVAKGNSTDSQLGRHVLPSWSTGRVVVAILLVAALVFGAAAVRTLDIGAYDRPTQQSLTTDSPDAAVTIAVRNTVARSHRQELYAANASTRNASFRLLVESGVDYTDRQAYTYFHGNDGSRFGGYFSETALALRQTGGSASGLATYQTENWTVIAVPAWGLIGGGESYRNTIVPQRGVTGWSTVSSNDTRLVVRLSNATAIPDAFGSRTVDGVTPPLTNDSYLTVSIDKDSAALDEVRFHLHSEATGRNMRYRLVYVDVGTADLRRPAPLGDRRAVERLWDAVYY